MDSRPRNANGTFQKGQPPPVEANRKKGVPNKITKDIREGAIEGFTRHGSNGRGEGGFAGFCFYLAKKHPKAAAKIVEKLLPLNIHGQGFGNRAIGQINIVSVPHGVQLTKADMDQLREPHTIEHQPQLEAPEHYAAHVEPEVRSPEEAQSTDDLEALSSKNC
jgi:hypothetical protein